MSKRQLVLRVEARRELEESVAWYEAQLPDLGRQFRAEVYRCLDAIGERPELYPAFQGAVRKTVLRRFPYLIFYLVERRRIVVLAIFHAKRNPDELAART